MFYLALAYGLGEFVDAEVWVQIVLEGLDLWDRGTVRIVDIGLILKRADGSTRIIELNDRDLVA
jgi:hypothetical protein